MNQQRKRHLKRMPLDEVVRLALSEIAGSAGSVEVEVHDYDGIQGLVVWIELAGEVDKEVIAQLGEKMRFSLNEMIASNPSNLCLASWSVVFKRLEQTIASLSVFDK